MSNFPPDDGGELSRAEAVDARAADWMLTKQMAEVWSEQDQEALNAWLAESTSHVAAYWRLDDAWGRAKRLKALRSPTRDARELSESRVKPHVVSLIAALVVGVLLAGWVWSGQSWRDDTKTYATPVGGHLTLTLADGSKIDLNTDTTLSLSTSPARRFASLQKGEAFFEIRHDAAHPFVVSVGSHRITDLGTKFLVRSDPTQVSVALIDGSARFESDGRSVPTQSTDLMPGDVAVATIHSMLVSKQSKQELKNRLGWRRGLLIFDNTTLAEAANELNRYNNEKIVIPDHSVARMTIGGTFFENDVPALLNTAKQVFGLSVHQRGNEIVISR
jgi:transmembrane sensor